MRRLLLVPMLFACLVGGVPPTGLPAQIAPRELRTRNMELVGYNGEVAAKTPELLQLVVQGTTPTSAPSTARRGCSSWTSPTPGIPR